MGENTKETENTNNTQTTDTNTVTETVSSPIVSEAMVPVVEVVPAAELTTAPVVAAEEVSVVADAMEAEAIPAEGGAAKKRAVIQYGIATILVVLMGTGLAYALEQQGRIHTGVFDSITELVHPTPAAAIVNGVKIPLASYEKNRMQLENNAKGQGIDTADATVKTQIDTQAIDVLVNTELLRQGAAKKNITASTEQIDARYKEIVASVGGEDKLAEKMVELGITHDSLMSDIEGEIIIQTFLSGEVDASKITISPKEVEDTYNKANTPEAKLPPLAEVKDQIASQLQSTKEQELVNAYIKTLREAADIETKI